MKTLTLPTTILMACTATLLSAAAPQDSNGDGVLTIDEVQAAMPEISVDAFNQMDTNADGALDAAEIEAAQTAGLMES